MKKYFIATLNILLFFALAVCSTPSALAAPGLQQIANVPGSWANDYPDTFMFIQNVYYYWADEFADNQGNYIDTNDTRVLMTISRFPKVWHFGDEKQFQCLLEGILIFKNISVKRGDPDTADSVSGLSDPGFYPGVGWNNRSKTTHLTVGCPIFFPVGDDKLRGIGDDSYRVMPLIGWEQRIGNVWLDSVIAYFHYFDDLKDDDTHGRDYFECNVIVSYHIRKWRLFLQGDYKKTEQSQYYGVHQNDDGYNIALGPGIAWIIKPNIELDLKYDADVDGKNELQGQGVNIQFLWVF